MDQVLMVGPFHFMMLRVLILLAWVKILQAGFPASGGVIAGGINGIDKAIVLYAVSSAVTFTLLWSSWGALNNRLGLVYTILGVYFVLRYFIRDEEDVARAIRALAWIAAVIALVMVIEQATGQNPYAVFGGDQQAARMNLQERDNHFRAMASFSHPILGGTFGATLLPLFIGLWWKCRKDRWIAGLGVVASTIITGASVSSTPVVAYLAGIVALCFWPLRKLMRPIRWGVVVVLVSLHLIMKAPVWALIGRTDFIAGSSGYHRYMLVDHFIRRVEDWWLLGTKDNGAWGYDMWDTANQYVAVGEDAGLFSLLCFVSAIALGFKYLGVARNVSITNKRGELFRWALGAALFSHVVAFFGISYFDQTVVVWYGLLAMISAVTVRRKGVSTSRKVKGHLESDRADSLVAAQFENLARTDVPHTTERRTGSE